MDEFSSSPGPSTPSVLLSKLESLHLRTRVHTLRMIFLWNFWDRPYISVLRLKKLIALNHFVNSRTHLFLIYHRPNGGPLSQTDLLYSDFRCLRTLFFPEVCAVILPYPTRFYVSLLVRLLFLELSPPLSIESLPLFLMIPYNDSVSSISNH